MNIKFLPQDQKWPAERTVTTNVGEFRPGQVLSMQEYQEKEARRLIENGDFVESPDAPTTATVATLAPELEEVETEKATSSKSKK
jgi:hypothetical protein